MLLRELQKLVEPLRVHFLQSRVYHRFVGLILAYFCARSRRKTLSAALPEGQDYSAFYRLFSQDCWSLKGLLREVIRAGLGLQEALGKTMPFVVVALDDTLYKKTGSIRGWARWLYDGTSGRFRPHLARGLRWIHAALLVFVKGEGPLALSVGFKLAPPLKRPPKNSPPELLAEYKKEAPKHALSVQGAALAGSLRADLDELGCSEQTLLLVVDGSYTNRHFLRGLPARTLAVGRVRKDIRLSYPAPEGSRKNRIYGASAPTPEALRQDPKHPWVEACCFFGGKERVIRFKELGPLFWPTVTQRRSIRLLVLAPTPYSLPGRKKKGYNQPGYFITTDLTTPTVTLLQVILERWQIEVLHRDLKSEVGSEEPQVWNEVSVHRVIPAIAGFYALLRIAALRAFGPGRDPKIYGELPRYRKGHCPPRASPRDLLRRLRAEVEASPNPPTWKVA